MVEIRPPQDYGLAPGILLFAACIEKQAHDKSGW